MNPLLSTLCSKGLQIQHNTELKVFFHPKDRNRVEVGTKSGTFTFNVDDGKERREERDVNINYRVWSPDGEMQIVRTFAQKGLMTKKSGEKSPDYWSNPKFGGEMLLKHRTCRLKGGDLIRYGPCQGNQAEETDWN